MATPYFALYPTDFLADVGHLGNTELGIYWRLLLVYYRDGRPLPFDQDRLRRLAMAFTPEEYRCLEAVVSEFFTLATGRQGARVWRVTRADTEPAAAGERREAAGGKAAAAAKARWSKKSPAQDAPSNAPSMPEAMLQLCQPEPEPEPVLKTTPTPSGAGPAEPAGFSRVWNSWPKSPRKGGRSKCLEIWRRAKLESAAGTICSHVEAMSLMPDWRKESGAYIPAPSVYLNGRRWDGAELFGQPAVAATPWARAV